MAASDYTIRSSAQAITPNAYLDGAVTELQTVIPIENLQHVSEVTQDIREGMAIMIEQEIMRLESFTATSITVSRGCADTIPQPHVDSALVWFFDGWMGTDDREYLANETIGVKTLPYTVGGNIVAIAAVPPTRLTFNQRFARPYAPGNVKVNGTPWFNMSTLDLASGGLEFTWNHRDRITQNDSLVSHTEASVGPEVGVTYTARVYSTSGTLKATYDSLAGPSWTYTLLQAQSDFGITAGAGPSFIEGYVTLTASRSGLESWQLYKAPIRVSNEVTP